MVEWHICLVSACGTPTLAVVFHSVEKSLTMSLCQTLCMNSVLRKPEEQNLEGCKCTTLHLPAGVYFNKGAVKRAPLKRARS